MLVVAIFLYPVTLLAGDAEELTDPVEILKRVDAATKAVKIAEYEVTLEGTGAAQPRMGKFIGTYTVQGWSGRGPVSYHARIKGTRPGSSEVHNLEAGGNGDMYFLVDHSTKKAYEDMDSEVIGSARRMIMAGMVAEFTHPAPFSDELNSTKKELRGSKTIEGEDCYEIHVQYANNAGEAVWCFSKNDFLPRSRHDLFKTPEGTDGGQLKTLKSVKTMSEVNKSTFTLELPEGYEKIDDFAP
jgi:hypothetical protein